MNKYIVSSMVLGLICVVLCVMYFFNYSILMNRYKEESIHLENSNFLEAQLVKAVLSRNKMKIHLLIALGAKTSPISIATALGKKYEVEKILKRGFPSGMGYSISKGDFPVISTEYTSVSNLYIAALYNQVEIAKLLLKYGANVNDGKAVSSGHSGPIVSGSNTYVTIPLTVAVDNGYKGMIQLLLEDGANVNYEDIYGYRPLDFAHDDDIKQILIKYGAEKGSRRERMEYFD